MMALQGRLVVASRRIVVLLRFNFPVHHLFLFFFVGLDARHGRLSDNAAGLAKTKGGTGIATLPEDG